MLRFTLRGFSAALAAWLCPVFVGSVLAQSRPEPPPQPQTRAEHFTSLRSIVEREGEVPVIVQFARYDVALPDLPPQAQASRMTAIAATREAIVADLRRSGTITNEKAYRYTPYVAFWVDARGLNALERHPLALEVVEDVAVPLALGQSGPLMLVDANAWAGGYTGAGQAIAILDTGVDKNHPFLAGRVVAEACFSTTSRKSSLSLCPGGTSSSTASGAGAPCSGMSGCEHGTHVAGIAAGRNYSGGPGINGVAPDAGIIAVQVFSKFTTTTNCGASAPCVLSYSSDQKRALDWLYGIRGNYAIASANMSLGGGQYTATCDTNSLKPSVDNLRAAGTAVAIASGNNGWTNSISSPACISTAISVGSTCDASGNSYCSAIDAVAGYSNITSFVSLVAPGSTITSSIPGGGWDSWHGTSMATPQVAGAWAIKRQQQPTASVSEILADLRASAVVVRDQRAGGTVTDLRRVRFLAFNPPTDVFPVTVTKSGTGFGTVSSSPAGINCGSTCSASFAAGSAVTLSAAPVSGSTFSGWSGACSGTGQCSVSVSGAVNVDAAFATAPCSVPDAPTGLTATAQSKLRIALKWTDASDNEAGFRLERSTNGGTSWSVLGTVGANSISLTNQRLTAGVTYSYRIQSYNACGNSGWSNTASATARR